MKLNTNNKNMNSSYNFKAIKYKKYDSSDEYSQTYNDDLYKQDISITNNQDINYHNIIDNHYNLIKKQ